MASSFCFRALRLSVLATAFATGLGESESHCGLAEPDGVEFDGIDKEPTSLLQSRTVVAKSEDEAVSASAASAGTCSVLKNQGSHFTVSINVGTPAQKFDVVADTGSNAVIVSSCICQKGGLCSKKDKCFVGTNHSSSFAILETKVNGHLLPPIVRMTFGSGIIEAAVATDKVSVGGLSAVMNQSLLLMIARRLRISGPFEGILGLGLPGSVLSKGSKKLAALTENEEELEENIHPYKKGHHALRKKHPVKMPFRSTQGFLSQAKIPRFSVCFNDGGNGVLRLSQPKAPAMLGAVGRSHWAVELGGVSVGKASNPTRFCGRKSMKHGQTTPCAAIPDSGTTLIMAPKAHIRSLFADLCSQWPRCKKQSIKKDDLTMAATFHRVLLGCGDWVNSTHGLDQELPPLHFHLAGADGTKRIIKLGGAGYVMETMREQFHYVKKQFMGVIPIKMPVPTGVKKKMCTPAFGVMSYDTKINGPVWILGLPIFYEYQVGYELASKPPGISFTKGSCGKCGANSLVEKVDPVSLVASSSSVRQPRLVSGPRRLPSIDVNEPL